MATAKLDIEVNSRDATAALGKISSALDNLKVVAAAALGIFAGKQVADFFKSGIDAAVAQQQSLAKLTQQLKLTGSFTQEAVDDFAAFADQMEKTTRFGDDVVLNQLAIAKSFGLSNDKAKELVQAATELSAVTGDSLESSVDKLGKTLTGTAGELGKTIPGFKNLSKEALESGAAIDLVLKRFAGSAENEIQTFSGALLQAGNSFGNFQEEFGKAIIENQTVIETIKVFRDVLDSLTKLVDDNKDSISDFISNAIKVIIVSVPTAVEIIGFLIKAFQGLLLVGNLAFDGLVEIVLFFAKAFDKTIGSTIRTVLKFGKATGVISDDVVNSFEELSANTIKSIEEFSNASASSTADTARKFEEFNKGFEGFQSDIDKFVDRIFQADKKAAKSGKDLVDNRKKALEELSGLDIRSLKEISTELTIKVNAEIDAANAKIKAELDREVQNSSLIKLVRLFFEDSQKAFSELGRRSELAAKSIGKSFIDNISAGKEGARKFVAQVGGAIAEAFAPGAGQAVAQALEFLGQDPEAFREAINGFVKGIPEIIDNIIANIPILVEAIAENSGEIVTALANAMPRVAIALAKSIPVVIDALLTELLDGIIYQTNILESSSDNFKVNIDQSSLDFKSGVSTAATDFSASIKGVGDQISTVFKSAIPSFITSFRDSILAIGAGLKSAFADLGRSITNSFKNAGDTFVRSVIDAAKQFIKGITPGGGGNPLSSGGKGAITGIKGAPFAVGGTVPSGFPNDSFAASLTSNEVVIPSDDVDRLRSFLAREENSDSNELMVALLGQVVSLLSSPQQVSTSINIDGDRLAKAILNLDRRNARLTA